MKPRTSSVLTKIAARAERGDVEVEHLLLLARLADPSAAPALRELSATHDVANRARNLAHRFLRKARTDVDRSAAYVVLQRLGDESSLKLMASMRPERKTSPFAGMREDAIAALRHRLRVARA